MSITTESVFEALPENGDPVAAVDLCNTLGAPWNTESATAVRSALLELASAGRATVIYGKGWRRVPVFTADDEPVPLPDENPIVAVGVRVLFADGKVIHAEVQGDVSMRPGSNPGVTAAEDADVESVLEAISNVLSD